MKIIKGDKKPLQNLELNSPAKSTMKKLIIIIINFSVFSCSNSLTVNEEYQEEEINADSLVTDQADVENLSNSTINSFLEIEKTLVFGENDQITVQVDQLSNDQLVLRSWNKPKSTQDKPDVELSHGQIEKQGKWGFKRYVFYNGNMKFSIEESLFCGDEISLRLFYREGLLDAEPSSILTNKLVLDKDKDAYSKADFTGIWTEYPSSRKIEFLENNRFQFNTHGSIILSGSFSIYKRNVVLYPDTDIGHFKMKIGGGKNDFNLSLVGLMNGNDVCFIKIE